MSPDARPARPAPPGSTLRLSPGTRRYPQPDGGVLLGGSPLRVLRFNRSGWRELTALAAGLPVRSGAAAAVAGRLLDGGLADPTPAGGGPEPAEVTIVVPVRDRPAALARCLRAVGPAGNVLVVDDASRDPARVAQVAAAAGATVIRRARNGGPAAARNTGLAACRTPYVAFVDSDCVPDPDWLRRLLPHFTDPAVGMVAPRIVALTSTGWLGRYEAARSSLDLGQRPGRVAPLSPVAYVPAAAAIARRAALGAGFAEDLPVGEDVDLVWRLHAQGWRIRYEPAATVAHDHRVRLASWARRKFDYGTSAGPLARRHPGLVPPAVTSAVSLMPLWLLRSGRPRAAVVTIGLAAAGLSRRLPPFDGRGIEAVRLTGVGSVATAAGLAKAQTRAWLPLALILAARSRRWRIVLVGNAVAVAIADWAIRRPALDPVRWTVAFVLDDASYCAGLWTGALRARTLAPLLPAVPEWGLARRRRGARSRARTRAVPLR